MTLPTRTQISDAVAPHGWRLLLGCLHTLVPVASLQQAVDVAHALVAVAGASTRLRLELGPEAVLAVVGTAGTSRVTSADVELALTLSAELRRVGATTLPLGSTRSTQALEIAIDAIDADAIRPFWRAVLAYEPGPAGDLVDPYGVGPSVWFQQMDTPRPQRNRIHFDVSVPHDEVRGRLAAAVAAGGRVLFDGSAPAFWVLADAEGNEACLCTWQGRDG